LLLRHSGLELLLAIAAHLLLLRHAGLDLLLAVGTHLLLLCHARLRLLGACGLSLLHASRARLLALGNAWLSPHLLGPRLLALRNACLSLHVLRTRLLSPHLRGCCTLRPFDRGEALLGARRRESLALDPRRSETATAAATHCLRALATATATLPHDLRLALAATVAARSGSSRDRDRQSGDSCGEKYPGHHTISFKRQNGLSAAPFQQLNGWNLHFSALG
jgi:hypothetical protein